MGVQTHCLLRFFIKNIYHNIFVSFSVRYLGGRYFFDKILKADLKNDGSHWVQVKGNY